MLEVELELITNTVSVDWARIVSLFPLISLRSRPGMPIAPLLRDI